MAVAGGAWPLGSQPAEIHGKDSRKLSVLAKPILGGRSPIMPDSPIGMCRGSSSVVPPVSGARKNGRGMRPAGGNRRSPQKVNVVPTDVIGRMVVVSDGPVVKENARVVPLSVEVGGVFSQGRTFETGPHWRGARQSWKLCTSPGDA